MPESTATSGLPAWIPEKIDELNRWRNRKDISDALLEQQVKAMQTDLTVVKDNQREAIAESRAGHKELMRELNQIESKLASTAGQKELVNWASPILLSAIGIFLALREVGAFG